MEIDELCRAVMPYHNANSVNDHNFYELRLKYSKTLACYAEILGRKRETGTGTENNALQKYGLSVCNLFFIVGFFL